MGKKSINFVVALIMMVSFLAPQRAQAYWGNELQMSKEDASVALSIWLNIKDLAAQMAGLPTDFSADFVVDVPAEDALLNIPGYGTTFVMFYRAIKGFGNAWNDLADAYAGVGPAKQELLSSSVNLYIDSARLLVLGSDLCLELGMQDFKSGTTRTEDYINSLDSSANIRNDIETLRSSANNAIFMFDSNSKNTINALAQNLEDLLRDKQSGTEAYKAGYAIAKALAEEAVTLPVISVTNGPSGTLTKGEKFFFRGKITSQTPITSATVSITRVGGSVVQTQTVNPMKTNVDFLNDGLDNLKFGELDTGAYTFKLTATNSAGTSTWSNSFNISGGPSPSTLAINMTSAPSGTLRQGAKFYCRGTISSNYTISSVTTRITASGGSTVQTLTVYPNKLTVDILNDGLDELKFAELKPGAYTLEYIAVDSSGKSANKNYNFQVAGTLSINVTSKPVGTLPKGQPFFFRGSITSDYKITEATVSITNTAGTVIQTKTVYPNKTSVDILADGLDSLKFGSLASGSYILNLSARDSSGTTAFWSQPFSIG